MVVRHALVIFVIYFRKISILGKHNKQIISGAWSQQNYLALVASDKSFTLSNADGDTLHRTNLKGDPSLVQFSSMKQDGPGGGETTVRLFLFSLYYLLGMHRITILPKCQIFT